MMNICTVVVTYNRLDLLKGALDALRSQDMPHDILVVNNGSTDGTTEYLNSQTDIHVLHQSNVGGAGGFYSGLKYACECGYDDAWVMDDDVLPQKDALRKLVEKRNILESKGEKVGFMCSHILNVNDEPVNLPTVDTRPGAETGYPTWTKNIKDGVVKVSCSTFVSVLIPCHIVYELGLPYKEYFIWGDDTEYTSRISYKYPSYFVSDSYVTHLRVGNGAKESLNTMTSPQRIQMFTYGIRNQLFSNRLKHVQSAQNFRYTKLKALYIILSKIKQSILFLLNGDKLKAKTMIVGCFKGLFFSPKVDFPKTYIL